MLTRSDPNLPALTQAPLADDRAGERRGLMTVWFGLAAMVIAATLLIAEVAAIPFQVSESVTAADSIGNVWPLLGVLMLGAIGAAGVMGGRRARRTARRRREWLPSIRR